jgi:DNA-binding phage protein
VEQVVGISDDVFMDTEEIIETLRKKFERVSEVLDERGRRVWAAAEAEALGYGGQSIVAKATGLARTTLYREGLILLCQIIWPIQKTELCV